MSQLKFKLSLDAKRSDIKIGYQQKIMLVGSCFSENMTAKFAAHQFEVFENAHGVLFNPVSVANSLQDLIDSKVYSAQDLFYHNDIWNSWNHHSRFSGITPDASLLKINASIQKAHQFLKESSHIIITLGSAWLYHVQTDAPLGKGQVVANNHKGPAKWFTKELMQPNDLKVLLEQMCLNLHAFNPDLHIIFTISPVRHLREGLVENNRSKAALIYAVHELVHQVKNIEYFPAYEYVIDDLRDYRFYAEDLVHPNYAATQYVWEKFVESYMSEETNGLMKQVAELQLAMHHKPFFIGSTEHQKFLQVCISKTERLMQLYPFLALTDHLHFFKGQVAK